MKSYLFILIYFSITAHSHALPPSNLRICALESGFGDFTNTQGTGIWQQTVKAAAKELNINIYFEYAPRERCLFKAKKGDVDAVFAAFTKDRDSYLRFPRKKNQEEDISKIVGTVFFKIYKKRNSNIDWNGKEFINLGTRTVGVQRGLQVASILKEKNIETEGDIVTTPEQNLIKLSRDRIVAAAIEETQADKVIKDQNYSDIVKVPTTFSKSDVHLAFSQNYYEKNQVLAEKIWLQLKAKRRK